MKRRKFSVKLLAASIALAGLAASGAPTQAAMIYLDCKAVSMKADAWPTTWEIDTDAATIQPVSSSHVVDFKNIDITSTLIRGTEVTSYGNVIFFELNRVSGGLSIVWSPKVIAGQLPNPLRSTLSCAALAKPRM